MKNKNFILVIVSVLSVSIVLTGCYSFRPISEEQLKSKSSPCTLKFKLDDDREVIISEEDSIVTSAQHIILITKQDSTEQQIYYESISKIYEEKFDVGKTLFAGFWTLFGLILVWGLLIGGSFRVG